MELIDIKNITNFQESKVVKKVPIITDQLMSTLFFIDSNTSTPAHTHTDYDEIHYIIKGSGEIVIGKNSRSISEGLLVVVPKSVSHHFSTTDEQLIVLTVSIVGNYNKK